MTKLRFTRQTVEEIAAATPAPTANEIITDGSQAVTDYAARITRTMLAEGYTASQAREAATRVIDAYNPALDAAKPIQEATALGKTGPAEAFKAVADNIPTL